MTLILRKSLYALVLTVCAVALSACSGRSQRDLIKTVPEDAGFVCLLNLDPVYNALEIKADGENFTYCSELKDLFTQTGVSNRDVNKILSALDQTHNAAAIFEYDKQIYFTAFLKDVDNFEDYLEEADKNIDFEDEDGMRVNKAGNCVIDGNQLWCSTGQITPADIKNLRKQKNFAEKYPRFTEQLCEEEAVFSVAADLDRMAALFRVASQDQEAQFLQTFIGTAYKDAAFVVSNITLSPDKMEATAAVYNDRQEMATPVVKMQEIDPAVLAKVDCNAPLVAALGLPKEAMQQVGQLFAMMTGGTQQSQQMAQFISGMTGTAAFSVTDLNSWTVCLPFPDNQAATVVGTYLAGMLRQGGVQAQAATAGNYMILRSDQAQNVGGKAPDGFADSYDAAFFDFAKIPESIVSGHDFSKLGTILATNRPQENGIVATITWTCKNPLRTLISECLTLFQEVESGKVQFPMLNGAMTEPEPDLWEDSAMVAPDDYIVADSAAYAY